MVFDKQLPITFQLNLHVSLEVGLHSDEKQIIVISIWNLLTPFVNMFYVLYRNV